MLAAGAGAVAAAAWPGTAGAAQADQASPDAHATGRQPARRIPQTLAVTRPPHRGRSGAATTDFPLTHLGVTWLGPLAHVRLRTPRGWTGWRTVNGCAAGPDAGRASHRGPGGPGGSALLVVPGALGYEVQAVGAGTAQVTELNTVDGPALLAAAAVATSMPLPDGRYCPVPYLSRAAWGADETLRYANGVELFPPEYYPVQVLTVHHSAGANNDPDPAATVRAIYYYQAVTKGWGDIGYHLLIDEAGQLYEGRWSGADPVPVFAPPVPGAPPLMTTGAHVASFNAGNIGVCLLGDLTAQQPAAAARRSLVILLTELARVCRLDPLGTTGYVNPSTGASRTVRTICGHRDWAATQCPGNAFYPQLDALRQDVANMHIFEVPRKADGPAMPAPPRR
jgi:hypothetical protein